MSGYIVEEENETTIYNDKHEIINDYWKLYSPLQKKRFYKVLRQLKETWYDVYNQLNFVRQHCSIVESNQLMSKIYNLFFVEHKHKIEYYREENLKLRRQKGYLSKRIIKLKNTKQKI